MNLRAPGDPLRRTISAKMFLHSAPNGMQHLLLGIEPTTSGEHGHQAAGSDRQLAGLTPKKSAGHNQLETCKQCAINQVWGH